MESPQIFVEKLDKLNWFNGNAREKEAVLKRISLLNGKDSYQLAVAEKAYPIGSFSIFQLCALGAAIIKGSSFTEQEESNDAIIISAKLEAEVNSIKVNIDNPPEFIANGGFGFISALFNPLLEKINSEYRLFEKKYNFMVEEKKEEWCLIYKNTPANFSSAIAAGVL